jgi:hypothetical protein
MKKVNRVICDLAREDGCGVYECEHIIPHIEGAECGEATCNMVDQGVECRHIEVTMTAHGMRWKCDEEGSE